MGIYRDLKKMKTLADLTGVNIVCGTGKILELSTTSSCSFAENCYDIVL